MTRMGRKPQGVELIAPLDGSEHAKRRLTLFLETLAGRIAVGVACAELGIVASRFYWLRSRWLQESLALLEPRAPGRPCRPAPVVTPEEARQLQGQVRDLEARVLAAEVRVDLAAALGRPPALPAPLKKTAATHRPRRAR